MFETSTNDRPGLDEAYISATNASDLTLDPDCTTAVDHLIAAALSGNRMSEALGHLQAEWGKADKPPPWTGADVAFRADLVFTVLGRGHKGRPDLKRARAEVVAGYAAALRGVYKRLPSRAWCLALLTEWAGRRGVDSDLLSPALYHWLNPACPACHGRAKDVIAGTPVLGKDCNHCAGAGTWPRPLGADRVETFLKGCVGKAGQERGNRLRS